MKLKGHSEFYFRFIEYKSKKVEEDAMKKSYTTSIIHDFVVEFNQNCF